MKAEETGQGDHDDNLQHRNRADSRQW